MGMGLVFWRITKMYRQQHSLLIHPIQLLQRMPALAFIAIFGLTMSLYSTSLIHLLATF